MTVLYHLTIPQPSHPLLDATVQEAESLRAQFGGRTLYVNPARRPGFRYPERLYGLQALPRLWVLERDARLHHVYNPHPLLFPYLRLLRRPVIYTITAGLRPGQPPAHVEGLRRLTAVVVSNAQDRAILQGWGLDNARVVRPGIDTDRFQAAPPPPGPGFVLLAGSAPWTAAQFQTKGVTALLDAAAARSDLRLVFLWRGSLVEQLHEAIARRGLADRVEVIDRIVDANRVLARVHGAVVLADTPTLVKAFPHSLLEALVTGRPVLVSRALPMADYVERTGCGRVVERVDAADVLAALARLEADYDAHRSAALEMGRRDFSRRGLLEAYGELYALA
ncbi:MAG: glycosyltransferase [Anaerolineae bacterium]|jgi:glycosyltransferase involved in cell wall biosynthesis